MRVAEFRSCQVPSRFSRFCAPSPVLEETIIVAASSVHVMEQQRSSPIDDALLKVFRHGEPTTKYSNCPYVPPRGFFAMLNVILDRVLSDIYRGRGPKSVKNFYHKDCLGGYGSMRHGVPLSRYFVPIPPPKNLSVPGAPRVGMQEITSAAAYLRTLPRYVVTSRLARLLFNASRTRNAEVLKPDVAIHIRRGDKLLQPAMSAYERSIGYWNESQIASAALRQLSELSTSFGDGTHDRSFNNHVLISSDDRKFAVRVVELLQQRNVSTELLTETRVKSPSTIALPSVSECTAACVPPLLELVNRFSQASALLVSTKSNMGGFLLTSYSALNNDKPPRAVVDMDGALHHSWKWSASDALLPRSYFCALAWGPRYGFCDGQSRLVQTCAGRPWNVSAGVSGGDGMSRLNVKADDCGVDAPGAESSRSNRAPSNVALLVSGLERSFLSSDPLSWGYLGRQSLARHVVDSLLAHGEVSTFMCLEATSSARAPQRVGDLPQQLIRQLRIVRLSRHDVNDRNAFITRRKHCFEEIEEYEKQQQQQHSTQQQPFKFTHIYLTRTETAWYEDVPSPHEVEGAIMLRARKLRTESGRSVEGLSLEHFSRKTAGVEPALNPRCLISKSALNRVGVARRPADCGYLRLLRRRGRSSPAEQHIV